MVSVSLHRGVALFIGAVLMTIWLCMACHYWVLLPEYNHIEMWGWYRVIEWWALLSMVMLSVCGFYVGLVMLYDEDAA